VDQISLLTPELVVATAEAVEVTADGRRVTRSTTLLDAQVPCGSVFVEIVIVHDCNLLIAILDILHKCNVT
jgi:hypothetical protein